MLNGARLMGREAFFKDLGVTDYRMCYNIQLDLVEKLRMGAMTGDIFLLTEHPSVLTLGRRGGRKNLTVSEEFLHQKGVAVVPVERGGDITYHGIGQLVVYPIIRLKNSGLSVTEYIFRLEEVMLRLSADYGVIAGRDPRNHGVWVGDAKLGSVGIAIRHGIAFHGLAININTCLDAFQWIHPCGLVNMHMTTLAREREKEIPMEEARGKLKGHLAEVFERVFHAGEEIMVSS
jgi:lipoyl(octanoyl) transferase